MPVSGWVSAQRLGERVVGVPGDLGDGHAGRGRRLLEEPARRVDAAGHRDQPHRVAVGGIGVDLGAGGGVGGLGEHEHVALAQQRVVATQRRRGGPRVAGRPRARPRCGRRARRGRRGARRRHRRGRQGSRTPPAAPAGRRARSSPVPGASVLSSVEVTRVKARESRWERGGGGRRPQPQPHPGVAPLVHAVVDEPGVAAQRDPAPRGAEVGLGGDRVLAPRQLVGHVGQRLHQRDADVGRVALRPRRRQLAEPLQHGAAEAGEVLGQVVDARPLTLGHVSAAGRRHGSRSPRGTPP